MLVLQVSANDNSYGILNMVTKYGHHNIIESNLHHNILSPPSNLPFSFLYFIH